MDSFGGDRHRSRLWRAPGAPAFSLGHDQFTFSREWSSFLRRLRVRSPSGPRTQFQQRERPRAAVPESTVLTACGTSAGLPGTPRHVAVGGALEVCRRRVVVFGLGREGFSGARGHVPMKSAVCGGSCSPETLAVVETRQLVSEHLLSATGVFPCLLTLFQTWSICRLN